MQVERKVASMLLAATGVALTASSLYSISSILLYVTGLVRCGQEISWVENKRR